MSKISTTKTNRSKSKNSSSRPNRNKTKTSRNSGKEVNKFMTDDFRSTTGTEKPYNDESWYLRNSEAADAAASIRSNYVAGTHIFQWFDRASQSTQRHALPGIMNIALKHTVGATRDNESAINLAAKHKFTEMRLKNTGSTVYEANDLMMYFLAMDGIYTAYAVASRIYRCLNLDRTMNLYYYNAILASLGMTEEAIEDFRDNIANLHYWLIVSAGYINSFNVPADIDLFKRHFFLYSNIFTESTDTKAGLIQFIPSKLCVDCWNENIDPDAWKGNFVLKPKSLPVSSYAAFKKFLSDQISAVRNSEDFGIMNGDIFKVYGEGGCYKVTPPAQEEKLVPIYSEEVLRQVQNAYVIRINDSEILDSTIYQDMATNTIRQSIKFSAGFNGDTRFMNFRNENPSTGEIFTSSRLTPVVDEEGYLISAGTEVPTAMKLITMKYNDDNTVSYIVDTLYSYFNSAGGSSTVVQLARLSMFKDHPLMYAYQINEGVEEVVAVIGDLDNYAIYSSASLANLHQTAIYSLFNVFAKY